MDRFDVIKIKKYTRLSDIDYIKVVGPDTSYYGGNQGWFSDAHPLLKEFGCGVIGMSDLELFFDNNKTVTLDDYRKRILGLFAGVYHFGTKIGLPPWRFTRAFKRFCRKKNIELRPKWRWRYSKGYSLDNLKNTLEAERPVMLAYNQTFRKKKALPMYRLKDSNAFEYHSSCTSHFFTATGLVEVMDDHGEHTYIQVSSWGKKLYVRYEDFEKGDFFSGMLILAN